MVHILFYKTTQETCINPDILFDNVYEVKWFDDPMVQRIIKEIDSSDVRGDAVIGPLGTIVPERLSGTAKTLILLHMYEDDYFEPDLVWVGDNGFQLFADIGSQRDIYCVLSGDDFNMIGASDFDFYCVNDGFYGHCAKDWLHEMNIYSMQLDIEVSSKTVKELCDDR